MDPLPVEVSAKDATKTLRVGHGFSTVEAVRLPHFYQDIPGWCDFAEYYANVVRDLSDGAHVVEVGVWQGKSTAALAVEVLNSGKAIRIDVVDHFKGSPEIPKIQQPIDQRAAFEDSIAPVRHAIRDVHDALSWDAASKYRDRSLDFVFLDADHAKTSVLKDLDAWWPKVKPGGILAGHDIDWESVQDALKPWAEKSGIRVSPIAGTRCWEAKKPETVDLKLTTPSGERKCLVAVCSNERSIYRQTAKSLLQLGWGQRVTDAAEAYGFADIAFAWIDKFLLVSDLRNEAAGLAIANGASHVLFLDADMQWPKDVLMQMLRHHDQGIVSGLYHLKSWPHWPVALKRPRVNPTTNVVDYDYDKELHDGADLVPVSLIGMGCTLVPTAVLREIEWPWFEYQTDGEGRTTVTEDVAFCQRAAAVGCPIWLDPSVKCGHIGQLTVTEAWYQRSLSEIDQMEKRGLITL